MIQDLRFKNNYRRGLTLVEVLVASAIILVAVVALLAVHSLYLRTTLSNADTAKAAYLAEEGIEVIRYWRDDSWNTKIEALNPGTDYGLVLSGGNWQATTGNLYVGNFERVVTLSTVRRDVTGDIVASGGSIDPDIYLVTAEVSWLKGSATTTRSISTYITNLYDN